MTDRLARISFHRRSSASAGKKNTQAAASRWRRVVAVALSAGMLMLSTLGASFGMAADRDTPVASESDDVELPTVDDRRGPRHLHPPEWFKASFLDLREDLDDAVAAGKMGLAIYFGMDNCPYCEALFERNFSQDDIVRYFSDHFDVVALDAVGARGITTLDGRELEEGAYAVETGLNFTPSFLFFDREGEPIHAIRGFYPPYRFRAALEYVVDRHDREGSFREYLEMADPPPKFELDDINDQPFFRAKPHLLDRRAHSAARPLVVFFERQACHACDVLHSKPLRDTQVVDDLALFDAVQLDVDGDTAVLTPDGQRVTAREWSDQLGIHWAPTLVFFDEGGREIIRVDSVVGIHRLRGVLRYMLTRAYEEFPTFDRWRQSRPGESIGAR